MDPNIILKFELILKKVYFINSNNSRVYMLIYILIFNQYEIFLNTLHMCAMHIDMYMEASDMDAWGPSLSKNDIPCPALSCYAQPQRG